MTEPSLMWSTIWSEVVELDSLTYHLGVPALFIILGLTALGIGRVLFRALEHLEEAEAPLAPPEG